MRLEHANICVKDIDAMIKYLQTAFPEFVIRGEGVSEKGVRWLHIGTEDTYVALQLATESAISDWAPYSGRPGVNHLAFEVDDVDALRARLLEAGYRESTPPNEHPHRKRVYFYDSENNDWEFVQYYSLNPAERNDYELPNA
ncbi:VOC family protein [Gemmatimonas aurantiaca]|nr:VOC family protein [Gemmatimonas aurantiaca]